MLGADGQRRVQSDAGPHLVQSVLVEVRPLISLSEEFAGEVSAVDFETLVLGDEGRRAGPTEVVHEGGEEKGLGVEEGEGVEFLGDEEGEGAGAEAVVHDGGGGVFFRVG